ncbi:MAG: hypothetical protein M3R10_01040 [Verrucomicrobiota bacterium]|nr:hypothetical protein [Verrucomicrobiota bacterium]
MILSCIAFSACSQERVVLLAPKENDLITINGCVISACNYLALVSAKHKLEADFWSKILLVRYENHPAGHAYCVWETDGTIYGYDRNSGGFPIPVYTRDPRAIAIVLAQELSKILQEPLAVRTAEFVEPGEAAIYKYSVTSESKLNPTMATTAPFRIGELALSTTRPPAAPNE